MHIVIIGNGIAGITAARHLRKRDSDVELTVISKESKYFFSRTALMYVYMGHMKQEHTQPYENWFWEKNRINLVHDEVVDVDFKAQALKLKNSDIVYDNLIIATGSKPNKFGWPGQDLPGVRGLYSLQDLEYLESISDTISSAAVVGGGLIGIELVEMLLSRGKKVHFIVRDKSFWSNVLSEEEGRMLEEHMVKDHHVDLRLGQNLEEIIPGKNGSAAFVKIKETGEKLPVEFVGLTAGVSANIGFLKGRELEIDKGILVDEYLRTNVKNVYAIGDCCQLREAPAGRRSIEQVWYVGRMMGETLAKTLSGKATAYNPGPWFNSAKFMDIEYQTYGNVPAKLEEHQEEFFWRHPKEYLAIRVVFERETEQFVGINTFGIRMRHHFFDHWLREGVEVDTVMAQLRDVNFDPEFYKSYEEEILRAYNAKFLKHIKPKKRSWQRILSVLSKQA